MTDEKKLEAKLERLVVTAAAHTVVLKMIGDEVSELIPGTTAKIGAKLREKAELNPEYTNIEKEQLTVLAGIFES